MARPNSVASGARKPGVRARSASHSAISIGAGRGRSRTAARMDAAPPPPTSELTEHIRGDRGIRRRSAVERSSTHTGHQGASANNSLSSSDVAGRSATSASKMAPRGGLPSPSRRTCMNGGAVTYRERRLMDLRYDGGFGLYTRRTTSRSPSGKRHCCPDSSLAALIPCPKHDGVPK